MSLVQIQKIKGHIRRVRPGFGPPIIEIDLEDYQRVISIELTEDWPDPNRVTSDWTYTAYIETRL